MTSGWETVAFGFSWYSTSSLFEILLSSLCCFPYKFHPGVFNPALALLLMFPKAHPAFVAGHPIQPSRCWAIQRRRPGGSLSYDPLLQGANCRDHNLLISLQKAPKPSDSPNKEATKAAGAPPAWGAFRIRRSKLATTFSVLHHASMRCQNFPLEESKPRRAAQAANAELWPRYRQVGWSTAPSAEASFGRTQYYGGSAKRSRGRGGGGGERCKEPARFHQPAARRAATGGPGPPPAQRGWVLPERLPPREREPRAAPSGTPRPASETPPAEPQSHPLRLPGGRQMQPTRRPRQVSAAAAMEAAAAPSPGGPGRGSEEQARVAQRRHSSESDMEKQRRLESGRRKVSTKLAL